MPHAGIFADDVPSAARDLSVRIDHQQQDSDPIGGNRSGKEGDEQADIDGQLDREKVTVSGARMVPPIIDAMPRSAQSPLTRKNPAEQRSERSPRL